MPAYLDDYLGTIAPRRQSRRPRSASLPFDLTPEQTTSLIGRAGGGLVSGLSAGANTLDLLGSSVRDVIGGVQTGDWSRHNPLDQWLDPFGYNAEENRVTGRDLLRNAGAIGKKDTWGNFAGGMGVDVLTDPLTYMTFGSSALLKGSATAGTKIGKAAKAAGTLPESLAGQIAGGHRGLAGLRFPFSDAVVPLGTGKVSQKIAGGIDKVAEAARYGDIPGTSFSPGRLTARLFDSALGDTRTKQVQKLAKGLSGKRTAEIAAGRLFSAAKARELIDSGLVTPENGDALRRALEGTGRVGDFDPAKMGDVSKFVDETIAENQQLLQRAQAAGMDVEAFQDSTNLRYFQRYLSAEGSTTKWKGKVLDTTDKSQIGREWYMRDIEGGTDTIQKIARDADIESMFAAKAKPTAIRDAITAKYGGVFKGNADKSALQHGTRFVESLMGMKPETRAAGVFGNHPVADMMHGMTSRRDAITVSEGINEFLQRPGMTTSAIGPDTVPADELLKSMKLSGSPLVGQGLHVPADIAKDLQRLHQGFTNPDSVNEVVQLVDSVTNLFKAGVTGVWPAFHVRNLTSGQWQNWISGTFDPASVRDAGAIMQGKAVKDAHLIPAVAAELSRRGMASNAKNGTTVLSDMAFAHELIGKFEGHAVDVAGQSGKQVVRTMDDITDAIPGINPTGNLASNAFDVSTYGGFSKGTSRNPLKVRGVGEQEASRFGPAKWGENLGHYVEGLNRLSPFINQLRKGVDPAQAAAKVGAAQVMYANKHFTPFESQFLARLFPFYKFSSRQLPYQLRMLADQPGGKLAQTLRGINRARNPDEMTPDYVAGTASIPFPFGEREEVSNRYLTGFGLPVEDPLSIVTPDLRSSGLEVLSRMNPLVKGPLEWMTGQTFFQKGPAGGRPLEDLDPTVGRLMANVKQQLGGEETRFAKPVMGSSAIEFVLANSPLSRALTSARTASDPRKGALGKAMNLMTGFKVTDVSPGSQDALLQERADQAMKALGARDFDVVYLPEDVKASLTPEQQVAYLQLVAIKKAMQARKKERVAASK